MLLTSKEMPEEDLVKDFEESIEYLRKMPGKFKKCIQFVLFEQQNLLGEIVDLICKIPINRRVLIASIFYHFYHFKLIKILLQVHLVPKVSF